MQEIIKIILIIAVVLAEIWMILKANKVFNLKKIYKERVIEVNSSMFFWIFIIWTAMMGGGTIMEANGQDGSILKLLNLWWIIFMFILWKLVKRNIVILKESSVLVELSREINFSNIKNLEIRNGKKGAKVLAMHLRDNTIAYIPARDEYEAKRVYKLIKKNI